MAVSYQEALRLEQSGEDERAYEAFAALGGYAEAEEHLRAMLNANPALPYRVATKGSLVDSAPMNKTVRTATARSRSTGSSSTSSTDASFFSASTALRLAPTTPSPSSRSLGKTPICVNG